MSDRKSLLLRAEELKSRGFSYSKNWTTPKLLSAIIDFEAQGPGLSDRMATYRMRRPACPSCDAFPSVCMMKRGAYALWRCRSCGRRWETGVQS